MQQSSTVCVDSNIVVRLVTDPHDAVVLQLWERWRVARTLLIAPSLMQYEVTNAIYRLGRAGSLSRDEVVRLLNIALSLEIVMYDDLELHAQAADMAARFAQPAAYDAHFLALADRSGADFYTGDRRLWNVVRHHLSWVYLVADDEVVAS